MRLTKGLALLCLAGFLCVACHDAEATTVTGNVQDLTTQPVSASTFVRFDLKNCGGNMPRIIGSTLLAPTSKDFTPVNGTISGTIVPNSSITCDVQGNTYYTVSVWNGGAKLYSRDFVVSGTSFNLNSATPLLSTPTSATLGAAVVTNPTADQTIVQPLGTNLIANNLKATLNFDASTALSFPVQVGPLANRPAQCAPGQYYFVTDSPTPGQNTYACYATNQWALQGDGAGANLDTIYARLDATNFFSAAPLPTSDGLGFGSLVKRWDIFSRNAKVTGGTFDASGGLTLPFQVGTALPGTCVVGQIFFNTTASAGLNTFGCTSTNVWTLEGDAGGSGTAGVTTFNGRNGAVVPATNDYSFAQLSGTAAKAQIPAVTAYTDATNDFSAQAQTFGQTTFNYAGYVPFNASTDVIHGTKVCRTDVTKCYLFAQQQSTDSYPYSYLASHDDGTTVENFYKLVPDGASPGQPLFRFLSAIITPPNANADLSASFTFPHQVGTLAARPGTCIVGQTYFATDATVGQNISACTSTNVWTTQGDGGGVTSVTSFNGRTGAIAPNGGGTCDYCTLPETFQQKTFDTAQNTLSMTTLIQFDMGVCPTGPAGTASSSWSALASGGPSAKCFGGTNLSYVGLGYGSSATQSATRTFMLPTDWLGSATGTFTVRVRWLEDQAPTSGSNIVWSGALACAVGGTNLDKAFNAAGSIIDPQTAVNAINTATFTLTGTQLTTCDAGNQAVLKLFRVPGAGGDDIVGTAYLIGVEISFKRKIVN